MQFASIFKALGVIVIILAFALIFPTSYAFFQHSDDFLPFLYSLLLCFGIGGFLTLLPKSKHPLRNRDGFVLVSFGWICAGLAGSLPYFISGAVPSFTDAFFESISGFTTTGSSIFSNIEALSDPLLLWRSMTQWFGGMGIIVLSLAILPYLDIGGMSIFQAEVPGPTAERLTPRIQDTAKILWVIYLIFTLILLLILWVSGMSLFEAINHAFTTMSTGGFSTKNTSIAGFSSPLIEWILIVFMVIAGVNFALHYRFLFKGFKIKVFSKDSELIFYLSLLFFAVLAISIVNSIYFHGFTPTILRDVAFSVVSIVTTTGYGTADYLLWPAFAQLALLLLMMIGGCAGSTSGGIKAVRIMLVLKFMYVETLKLIHPTLIRTVKVQESTVERNVLASILGFIFIYICVLIVSVLLISIETNDFMTAIGSVVSSLSNIGPGFGTVGPASNYAHLGDFSKWILSLNMIMGRLEILTVLVLFFPQTWRK